MKKFWLKHKKRITMFSSFAVSIAAGFLVVNAYNANMSAQVKSSDKTNVLSYEKQVESAVAMGDNIKTVTVKDISEANYIYNKKVMPVTVTTLAKLKTIVAEGKPTVLAAVIHPEYHTVALAYTKANGSKEIVAARFYDAQLTQINDAFVAAGLDVNVTYSKNFSVYSNGFTYYGRTGFSNSNSGSNNNSASGDVGLDFSSIFMLVLVGILFWFLIRRMIKMSNGMGGASKNVEVVSDVPNTTFADVAGCDEAIEDMRELVDLLKNPLKFEKVGAKAPKGALLVGPPGTGKTLLARAVAGEAGVPFYSVAGSDFVEMYVGVGAKRVRDLFDKARKHEEGAIIFIDEIDGIGRKRSNNVEAGNSEVEGTLNALLVELDGFTKTKIIVIGATNRDDMLDKALLRPGRLDRKIQVPLPDRQGRERILAVHSEGKPLAKDVDLSLVARRTPGMSGAELAQIINEACLVAARVEREIVTDADFDEAIATVVMGKARLSAVVSEDDRNLTAWHEAGHALCGLLQEDAVSPVSISIIPRGFAGGVTHFPARDSGYLTRKQAYAQLVTAMGGMAAEQMYIGEGEFTTGPSSDLQQATNLAFAMVTQYGMGENLIVKSDGLLNASSKAADEALHEANQLLAKALEDAKYLLTKNNKIVNNFVAALLEFETLTNSQIVELIAGHKVAPISSAPPAPRQSVKKDLDDNAGKALVGKVRFKTPKIKKIAAAIGLRFNRRK